MAALLFILSALSTNPNTGFFNDGCLGGIVTPFGGVDLVAQTTAAFLLPFVSFHRFTIFVPALLAFELLEKQASRGRVPRQSVSFLAPVPTLHPPITQLRTHPHLLLVKLGRETRAHVTFIFFPRLDRCALRSRQTRVPRRVVDGVDEGVTAPFQVRLLVCPDPTGCRCIWDVQRALPLQFVEVCLLSG